MKYTKHPLPNSSSKPINREQELFLINQALSTPKYHRISSNESLNHFFSNLTKASDEARKRIIKTNNRGLAKRSNSRKKNENK